MSKIALTTCAVALLAPLVACLGPQVSDEPATGAGILPPGSDVPEAEDDPALAAQIEEYDGVGDLVPLLTAFAGGAPVQYWDLGPTVDFAAPLFALRRRNANGDLESIGHPNIFDVVPGDPGYSPFWLMYTVEVTDAYQGEVLPSVQALQSAEQVGLVLAPEPTGLVINCPVVDDAVRLEEEAPEPDRPPDGYGYYRGFAVPYFELGLVPLGEGVYVAETDVYQLRREGGEPLREPARGVDMTGDGDLRDTNDIFAIPPDDPDATHLCRPVSVTVPSAYASIDTYASDQMADAMGATDLFEPGTRTPLAGAVVAIAVGDELRNCPFYQEAP